MEEADNRPFEYLDADGKLAGFHIELVRRVAEQVGWEVTWMRLPWKRAMYMLENGQIAALLYVGDTPERQRFAWFLRGNQLHVMRTDLYILRSSAGKVVYRPPLTDMVTQWRFGAALGYGYSDEINALIASPAGGRIEMSPTQTHVFKMLLDGRVDVAIALEGAMSGVRKEIAGLDARVQRLDGAALSRKPAYIAFSRAMPRSESAARRFEAAYQRLRGTTAYAELVARYGVAESVSEVGQSAR